MAQVVHPGPSVRRAVVTASVVAAVIVATVVAAPVLVEPGPVGAATGCASSPGATAPKGGHGAHGAHGSHGRRASTRSMCPPVPGARRIDVVADEFAFGPATIPVGAGEDVTLVLEARDLAHDLQVKGVGHVVHARADRTARAGLRIDDPGTYRFWCTVPGHRKAGMTGTITVS